MNERLASAMAQHRAGNRAEAERLYTEVLAADAGCADAWQLLGLLALDRGEIDRAVEQIERAIALQPGAGVYRFNLGVALKRRGDVAGAVAAYREAIARVPDLPEAHTNLGNALRELGDASGAAEACRKAVALRPAYAEGHLNLGSALQALGRFDDAMTCYRRALALDPKVAAAHYNIGLAAYERGQIDDAITSFRQALALKPDYSDAWNNLGTVVQARGEYQEALTAYRNAVRFAPGNVTAYRNLMAAMLYAPDVSEEERWSAAREFETRFAPALPAPAFANAREPERPIVIGYVSSDFYEHPVGRNLEPVLAHRDRARTKVICYAEVNKPDAMTARYQAMADGWRSTVGLSDAQVAEQLRKDGVDVLVLLAGRFDHNRPLIAAQRAAPVQVSFHDPATSGLSAMDYLIADRTLVPRRPVEKFTERVIRLPSFYIHAPLEGAPEVGPLPAAARGHITFASFNNPAKLNDRVLAIWRDLLIALPDARLRLKFKNWFQNAGIRSHIEDAFGEVAGRVEFDAAQTVQGAHLALYGDIDIAVDPFPFTGSTTTFEALWMGVPVLTLLGETMVGRWSASMLHALGLDELVARTPDDYVRKAVALADDPVKLAALRSELRRRVAASPLCDGKLRARQMDRIYRALWRRWCR